MPTLIPSSEDVRIYEVAVAISPILDQKEESTLLKEIDALFVEAQAKLLYKDPWTKRGLAYKIGGHDQAKFIIYYTEMPPEKIREFDHQLRLQQGVLRHLIVIPPKGYEAVSYEEKYQEWLKTRETQADVRRREKEEKVKKTVTDQAKRASKRMETRPKEEKAKPMEAAKITQELDKLIADSDLKL